MSNGITRRQLLETGASVAVATSASAALASNAFATESEGGRVEVEILGAGNVAFSTMSGVLVGETMYVGSRNLAPSRVVGFHVPSGEVVAEFALGNGDFVQGLAAAGTDVLYAGVTGATDDVNLYRCDLPSGAVSEVAAVPGLHIRDLAVAPDGVVYIVGRPIPHADGPPVYTYDPSTEELVHIGVPEPDADQGTAVAVTETTVYYGCGSSLTGLTGKGLFTIDRASGTIARELDRSVSMHGMRIFGDLLVTNGGSSALAHVLDLESGIWQRIAGTNGRAFVREGDSLIVHSNDGLYQVELDTWNVAHLSDDHGGANGVGLLGDVVVGSEGSGKVWTYDLASLESESFDLIEAGATGDAELGMSIAAAMGRVYVGGNNSVAVHDIAAGSVTKLDIPGEVKDMVAVDGTMYMGVYPRGHIWEHRIDGSQPPRLAAEFPKGQNRPHVVRWDDVHELVVLGVRNDSRGNGSLCVFDPATDSVTAHINPLGDSQHVQALAIRDGVAYIGGGTTPDVGGDLAAVDPTTGEELWHMEMPFGSGVSSLAIVGRRLFGITLSRPTFFVVDVADRPHIIHEADFSSFTSAWPRLLADRGRIYGAAAPTLFRVAPGGRYRHDVLIDDLNAEWFSGPRIAVDEDHYIYTLKGRDLVRVRDGRRAN